MGVHHIKDYQVDGGQPSDPNFKNGHNGGNGSGGGGMELTERVGILEKDMKDVRERTIRIESALPTLATKNDMLAVKNDISALQTDFHKELGAITWKFVTYVTTVATLLVGIVYGIARYIH